MYNMKNIFGLKSNTLIIIIIIVLLAYYIGKGACMNRFLLEGMTVNSATNEHEPMHVKK